MRRLLPQSTVQWFAASCVPIGLAAGVAETIHENAGMFPAGVGMGLWIAAAYLWLRGEAC